MKKILDARGLLCPLPVLRAQKAILPLLPGEELEVLATDPAAIADFSAFCSQTGHTYVSGEEMNGIYKIRLRRKN